MNSILAASARYIDLHYAFPRYDSNRIDMLRIRLFHDTPDRFSPQVRVQ